MSSSSSSSSTNDVASTVCDALVGVASSDALSSCRAPAVATVAAIVRPTLASTAKLFLPDQSSPILLAPNESEIHSDPRYYIFGAQLIASLVLFSIAYILAVLVLGCVRQREYQAKIAHRTRQRAIREAAALQRSITQVHSPHVRTTLYHVIPANELPKHSLDMELSLPTSLPLTSLQRVKRVFQRILIHMQRRVRYFIESILAVPLRFYHYLFGKPSKSGVRSSSSSASKRFAKFARITSFLHRSKPSTSMNPTIDTDEEEVDDATTLGLILGAFSSADAPWLVDDPSKSPQLDSSQQNSSRHRRRQSLSQTLSTWTAALSGQNISIPLLDLNSATSPASASSTSSSAPPPAPSPSSLTSSKLSSSSFSASFSSSTDSHHSSSSSSSSSLSHSDFPAAENEREFLTYSLATFVLAVAFVWLELLVLSVLASSGSSSEHPSSTSSSVPHALNQYYVLSWCTKELVGILWTCTVWMSGISLFVLAPFGFLYYEAHGIGISSSGSESGSGGNDGDSSNGFLSRVCETLLVLSIFTIFLYGGFHILQILIDRGGVLTPLYFNSAQQQQQPYQQQQQYASAAAAAVASRSSPHHVRAYSPPPITLTSASSSFHSLLTDADDELWNYLSSLLTTPQIFDSQNYFLGFIYTNLFESFSSNVWTFLPGLLLLLFTSHHGLIHLITATYKRAINVYDEGDDEKMIQQQQQLHSLRSSTSQKLLQQHERELNVIKLELSTAERKWNEMGMDLSGGGGGGRSGLSRRAIAPAQPLVTQHDRQVLLSHILSLRERHVQVSRQIQSYSALSSNDAASSSSSSPASSFLTRLFTSHPHFLRQSFYLLCTLSLLLLTWHLIFRVAQREANLIFRGWILKWFRQIDEYQAELFRQSRLSDVNDTIMERCMRYIWYGLYSLKVLLGNLLALLTGKVLNQPAPSVRLSAVVIQPQTLAQLPNTTSTLTSITNLLRLLINVLLGNIHTFNSYHPFLAFVMDLSCITLMMLASCICIYRSEFLTQFSPLRRFGKDEKKKPTDGEGEKKDSSVAVSSNPSAASSSLALLPPPSTKDKTSQLLFSPQYFTVNVVILLLLSSSLPLASWMLGLSSFDLLEFYPSAVQFSGNDQMYYQQHNHQQQQQQHINAPLFVHLYNISFLCLTVYHITQISSRLLLWVVFDQIVARIEVLIEHCRVLLGWSTRNARPEQKFKLFRTWRKKYANVQAEFAKRTRVQAIFYVLSGIFRSVHSFLVPIVRSGWNVACVLAWVLYLAARFLWQHFSRFVQHELDDPEEDEFGKPIVKSSGAQVNQVTVSPVKKEEAAHLRTESSMTTQLLLAEIDAAVDAVSLLSPSARILEEQEDDLHEVTPVSPTKSPPPGHRRSNGGAGGLSFFSRALSATMRFDDTVDEPLSATDEPTMVMRGVNEPSLTASPAFQSLLTSPLYRSTSTAISSAFAANSHHHMSRSMSTPATAAATATTTLPASRRVASYFMTPGIVPEYSRKLSTESAEERKEPLTTPISEEDFPPVFFTPPPAQRVAYADRIDEESTPGAGSNTSSATATPAYSPFTPLVHTLMHELDAEILDLSFHATAEQPLTPSRARHRLPSLDLGMSKMVDEKSEVSPILDASPAETTQSPLLDTSISSSILNSSNSQLSDGSTPAVPTTVAASPFILSSIASPPSPPPVLLLPPSSSSSAPVASKRHKKKKNKR